jgi:hypothetical protein
MTRMDADRGRWFVERSPRARGKQFKKKFFVSFAASWLRAPRRGNRVARDSVTVEVAAIKHQRHLNKRDPQETNSRLRAFASSCAAER